MTISMIKYNTKDMMIIMANKKKEKQYNTYKCDTKNKNNIENINNNNNDIINTSATDTTVNYNNNNNNYYHHHYC